MNIFTWNIKGTTRPSKKTSLGSMLTSKQLLVLVLQESKCSSSSVHSFASTCWIGSQCMAIDAKGTTGRLSILWDPQVISLTNFFTMTTSITAKFHIIGTSEKVSLSMFTGLTSKQKRPNSLTLYFTSSSLLIGPNG